MRNQVSLMLFAIVIVLLPATVCRSEEQKWGTLKGQVIFDADIPKLKPLVAKGANNVKDSAVCAAQDVADETFVIDPQTNGFANVVIYLAKKPAMVHPDLERPKAKDNDEDKRDNEVKFDQKGCCFVPHVLFVRTNQKIRVFNSDPIAQNVHSFALKNNQVNMIVPPNQRVGILLPPMGFSEKAPMKIANDLHPWMSAYWVVLDHPYAAITDKRGNYEIPDLPVGKHEFKIWHESSGWIEKKYEVTIKEGLNEPEPLTFAIETAPGKDNP